jgi:hypothetical protein
VYLDGERQIDFDTVGDLQDAGGDDGQWYIGRTRGPISGFAWLGLIDEVAIYPYALTEEQVQNHYTLAQNPVVITGDFDGSGVLDVADVDLLSVEIRNQTNNVAFDLNNDQAVNQADQTVWVADLKGTWFGDANLDGLFNTSDLITVLAAGQFEDNIADNSTWATGDWDADGDATTGDLVVALADGGFEAGPRPAVAAVPEPATIVLCWLGLCLACLDRRRRIT